ncbi:hypothetical protein KUTeg_018182 [Tegillarca granosa]|uniref:Uncharacterized protein n=1 Tax=Tegillarca granosa TaxID=220873 RepID=A0ABQ9EH40_TEGGR|nr:hypothetical protein KUTeg_018182 [Tegillarca granosa]
MLLRYLKQNITRFKIKRYVVINWFNKLLKNFDDQNDLSEDDYYRLTGLSTQQFDDLITKVISLKSKALRSKGFA